jgi:hypothetical protein
VSCTIGPELGVEPDNRKAKKLLVGLEEERENVLALLAISVLRIRSASEDPKANTATPFRRGVILQTTALPVVTEADTHESVALVGVATMVKRKREGATGVTRVIDPVYDGSGK